MTRAKLPLADGGVYDNLGAPWFLETTMGDLQCEEWFPSPNELLVVNSSTSRVEPYRLKLPIVREFLSLKRSMNVLYQASSRSRVKELDNRFANVAFTGEKPGVVVSIDESPFDCPEKFRKWARELTEPAPDEWAACHERAIAAEAYLRETGEDRFEWSELVVRNSQYKTTLGMLGEDCTASLIRHGYAVAMVKLYSFREDYQLVPVPSVDDFKSLVQSGARPRRQRNREVVPAG